jgi:regulator of sirC expression with transglutaminase-like and TPR domain
MANETPQQRARQAFIALIAGTDASIDLAQAALLIANEEYPDLDIGYYITRLDRLAVQVCTTLGFTTRDSFKQAKSSLDTFRVIEAINSVLFEQEHFQGNSVDYYNPENSFLNDVLDTRKGIPITLSLIYMEMGKRLGLSIAGIGLPFHFVVRCPVKQDYLFIDPFEKGQLLSEEDCRQRVYRMFKDKEHFHERWLEPVTHRQLLVRMLANLKHIYLHKSDYERALAMCDRILLLAPNSASEKRDRGIVHMHLKHYARALSDLTTYIERAPHAEDFDDIRKQIKSIRQIMAMMN